MTKFVAIHFYKPFFNNVAELFQDDNLKQFIKDVQSPEGKVLSQKHLLYEDDIKYFIDSLSVPSTIVFQGWIEYKTALYNLLIQQGEVEAYTDNFNHLNHKLSEEYKDYISPYLGPVILEKVKSADLHATNKLLSYTKLLNKKYQAVVEEQLFEVYRKELNRVKQQTTEISDEKELINCFLTLLSDESTSAINHLSRASYAHRVFYVEAVLNFINHPACTIRLSNWILKEVEKIQLNKEQLNKIEALKTDLKEGRLKVKNTGVSNRISFSAKRVLTYCAVVATISVAIFLIVKKPFSEVDNVQFSDDTSFEQFTKAERLVIDSLLHTLNGQPRSTDMIIDPLKSISGESGILETRKKPINELLDNIILDNTKMAMHKQIYQSDSCAAGVSFSRRNLVKNLMDKKDGQSVFVTSKSEYDVIIYVAQNALKGKVYSTMIKKGEELTIKLNSDDIVLIVPGNNFNTFEANKNADESILPSAAFKAGFCEIDMNFLEQIVNPYRFTPTGNKSYKLLLTGDKLGYFKILDIYGVLNPL